MLISISFRKVLVFLFLIPILIFTVPVITAPTLTLTMTFDEGTSVSACPGRYDENGMTIAANDANCIKGDYSFIIRPYDHWYSGDSDKELTGSSDYPYRFEMIDGSKFTLKRIQIVGFGDFTYPQFVPPLGATLTAYNRGVLEFTDPRWADIDYFTINNFGSSEVIDNIEITVPDNLGRPITNNNFPDTGHSIDGGQVVWEGYDGNDWEILFYDGSTTERISIYDFEDKSPSIDGGQVVWTGWDGNDWEIFFFNGVSTIQLTDNDFNDRFPSIDGGKAVWRGYEDDNSAEIFFFNGVLPPDPINISNNNWMDSSPSIDGDQVVWRGYDGNDWEIFLYDYASKTKRQLTTNEIDDGLPSIDGGQVVWTGWDGNDWEIFLYDYASKTKRQLTTNEIDDGLPLIDGGQVVWMGWDGTDYEIFFYDGVSTIPDQLSTNNFADTGHQIDGGKVVWQSWDGNGYDIFFFDGSLPPIRLTNNNIDDSFPLIDDVQVVWREGWLASDWEIFRYVYNDIDEDGIQNNVDTLPSLRSKDFSDISIGGTSYGTIEDRGDQILKVEELENPAGVRIISVSSVGPTPASGSACGGDVTFSLTVGDEAIVTCTSVTIEVIRGPIEITLFGSDGTTGTLSLNAGNAMTFDADTLTITADAGNSEDVVVYVGEEEISIPSGETATMVTSPQDRIDLLIAEVEDLVDTGVLNKGQGISLTSKLEAARKSLDKENVNAAINQLQTFIKHVETFVKTGKLSSDQGEVLVATASKIIDLISE